MLRFFFTLDEVPAELVYDESTAYYRLDGTLGLAHGTQVVFEETALPVVEIAEWLSVWWMSQQPARVYEPDWADPDRGPLLVMAPAGGSCHRLTHSDGDDVAQWTAERTEWEKAVTQFREDMRQAVLERYGVRLDERLPSFKPFG